MCIRDQGATHYMTFRHATAGLTRGAFTAKLFRDGSDQNGINVDIKEVFSQIYVASFINDGTLSSTWTLVVYQTAAPATSYQETWFVRTSPNDKNIAFIKASL